MLVAGILNTGEVPNLFNNEEFGQITESLIRPAQDAGINTGSPAELFAFFINRCRTNLHVVLCLSPIGDAFRTVSPPTSPLLIQSLTSKSEAS